MSWSGFKKNVGRATTQVMMKTGHVEKTSDRDYEVEERRYRTLESASLRLQKEAKGYLDSLRAMTASQMRIAETIDAFYGESGARDGVSRSYKQAVEDLDAETVKALDGPYRCVSRYPKLEKEVPPPPREEDDETSYRKEVLGQVEQELNFARGNKRHWTKDARKTITESEELMDHVCRTTVLEPINRFCAYFPDINECIKKRNHKMLDYDSMRSKVKKLTEKPDKDPGKLPRTEKETEMVKHTHPRVDLFSDDVSAILVEDLDDGSVFLSPPKVLDGLKHKSHPDKDVLAEIQADEDAALRSVGLKHRSNVLSRLDRARTVAYNTFWGLPHNEQRPTAQEPLLRSTTSGSFKRRSPRSLLRSPSVGASAGMMMAPVHAELIARQATPSLRDDIDVPDDKSIFEPSSSCSSYAPSTKKHARELTLEQLEERSRCLENMPIHPAFRSRALDLLTWQPMPPTPPATTQRSTSESSQRSRKSSDTSTPRITVTAACRPGHWFNPSELEEMLQPIKEAFIEEQADQFGQAKAAYEQLNDQLTDELPKLIDLRVPYLDPSFEALVKIQLRFCAEAYSRMAQVQQYLDASTRDQYASGDLDARVEDVLGQIRELSIAGTV